MDINNFKSTLVKFDASKVKGVTEVWVSDELPDSMSAKELTDFCSVCIKNSPGFSKLEFEGDKTVSMLAERYGGQGILSNAGGVRCGNIKNIQVKGIGQNVLVGDHEDFWHSNGSLPLTEAVLETVNSLVFQKIFPVGVSKSYGLLRFSKPVAYNFSDMYKEDKSYVPTEPGALMVREICVRPAHFMVNPHYKPKYALELECESSRIRKVSKELYGNFKNRTEFIKFLGMFLKNCADQFAFAKINRIMHGAMTPSNISVDGRWLDLTNICTLPGRDNYSRATVQKSFLEEVDIVKPLVFELVYNVCKYEKIPFFNIDTLFSYFDRQAIAYHNFYFLKMIGLSDYLEEDSFGEASDLTKAYLDLQRRKPKAIFSLHEKCFTDEEEISKYPEKDEVIWFVLSLFKGAFNSNENSDNEELSFLVGKKFSLLSTTFNNLVGLAERDSGISRESIILSSLVKYLSEKLTLHYVFPSLEGRCRNVIEKDDDDLISQLMVDSEKFIENNYNVSNGEEINIFNFNDIRVSYLRGKGNFILEDKGKRLFFSNPRELHEVVSRMNSIDFDVWGFSCKTRVLSVLNCFSEFGRLMDINQ